MRFFLSSLLAWSAVAANALAQPITYDVGTVYLYDQSDPTQALDYVLRGTITTNGNIGPLSASDFISWSLQVDGPIPFNFHPGNPNSSVSPSDASASPDELSISGQFGWLFIQTAETPSCSDCLKRVFWRTWGTGDVSYQNYSDDDVLFTTSGVVGGDPFVFATRIPEPLGLAMALFGAAFMIGFTARSTLYHDRHSADVARPQRPD
jgi:hypothetical protein